MDTIVTLIWNGKVIMHILISKWGYFDGNIMSMWEMGWALTASDILFNDPLLSLTHIYLTCLLCNNKKKKLDHIMSESGLLKMSAFWLQTLSKSSNVSFSNSEW